MMPTQIQAKRRLTIAKAMSEAIGQEMARDKNVLVLGEDIGELGGVFGTTGGLLEQFGSGRVRDTPISETGFIGAAVGMASMGMRPVVELMFVDFIGVCLDAVYNLAAKQSYFSGGKVQCPMVLMSSVGGGYSDAGQHSQCLFSTFGHLPGLKIVIPSNAYDAKGLLTAAIRDPNPTVFLFHKALQGMGWLGTVKGSVVPVPEEQYEVPLGKAKVVREGSAVTLVGLGATVHKCIEAAVKLEEYDYSAEVIDLRSIAPLDRDTIRNSVAKTKNLVVVDDDYHSYGVAGEVIASVCEAGMMMESAPKRLTFPDIPIPFSPALERELYPSAQSIVDVVRTQQGDRRL
ncbi:MAG: pyruvate/2-oxoglutarate/acetoin dehydrogenase E1 component [Porticoccaceae bacterium]|jgi:pyruvate/2-oxoglutarate/acetoin dehydrogenase E1 component